jgi:ABC-2 type transport system ATP-binding protein
MHDDDDTLRIRGVCVTRGSFEMRDIDLDVGPGEVVGYLGHNGAGKSTTFRVIADLLRPEAGVVTFAGLDHRRDEKAFKQRVTFVWDQSQVYSTLAVGDLLRFTRRLYPGWDDAFAERTCRELHLPLDRKASQLSKGMRTKLALVLAFSPRPRCVVLDEPTSGLDAASAEWFWELLADQTSRNGLGVLIASHSNDEVLSACDRVVILGEGRIIDAFGVGVGTAGARERLLTGLRGAVGGHERP